MKLGAATKLHKRLEETSSKLDGDVMPEYCDVIAIFSIYGHFGAIRKPDSRRIVCKTYIFINSNLLSYKNWKHNYEIPTSKRTLKKSTLIRVNISDNKLIKKYTQIWKKVRNLLNIKFNGKPIYGDHDKHIKTKLYGDKENTNFQGKNVPKQNTPCKCLPLIMLDSVIKSNKKYYPQALLEECKYEIKKIKMENPINDDLESSSSDDEIDSDSDNEFGNEPKEPSKKSDNESDNE